MQRLLIIIILLLPFRTQAMEKADLKIGAHILHVEVADSREEKNQGLMNRPSLGTDDGMIFVFYPAEPTSFWMKNTLIPLSLAFVDEKLEIVEIKDLNPPTSIMQIDIPRADSPGPVLFVIEANQGWFKRKKIGVNTKVALAGKTKNELLTKIFAPHARQKSSTSPNL